MSGDYFTSEAGGDFADQENKFPIMAQFLDCTVPAVSCTPDSCHLDWMIAVVARGLASSSCASDIWVVRHRVPVACLSPP